jgi:hypothetical protein
LFLRLLSVISIAVLTTLVAQPSYSDDVTINLDQTTPYVDVPVTVSEPVDATISTVTGTPDEDFIDSWIELWQGEVRLTYNDDGAHSATNVLASIISIPLQIGEYFIRATSYAYMCCQQLPVGSYTLTTNLVVATPTPTVSPSPSPSVPEENTPTPSPTPTQSSSEPSVEPTPEPSSPSPSPTDTPYPTSYPEVPEPPVQEQPLPTPEVLLESLEPESSPLPDAQDTLEEVVDSSPSVFPSYEPSLSDIQSDLIPSATDENLFQILLPDISLPPVLSEAVQQVSEAITDSLETISNLGSEFTPEEREQAQQVVLGAIIVTQLASVRRMK